MNNTFGINLARALTAAVVSGSAVFALTAPASAAPADCAYNPDGRGWLRLVR